MKPTLDENGRLIPREDYRISSLNCGGEDFAVACMRANLRYEKNQKREDVKSHHYIISFDPRDGTDNGLTVDQAQELGEKFCKEHFPGHQALVCTHPDGHNHSGNIHVHIVINSLRIEEVPFLPYMDRPADTKAGCKHRCTDAALRYFKSEVMEMCHREGLYQIDLLNGSKNRVTDREYWAQKKGQAKLDRQNAPMIAGGITPRQTKFETNKEKLRQTIRKALATAASFDEFSSLLLREGVSVKESRGRLSYLTPDRTKPITARKLGDDFDRAAVFAVLEQNAARATEKAAAIPEYPRHGKTGIQPTKAPQTAPKLVGASSISFASPQAGKLTHSAASPLPAKPDGFAGAPSVQRLVDIEKKLAEGKGRGYEHWAKIHNLKQAAKTLNVYQEYGFTSPEQLEAAVDTAYQEMRQTSGELKALETKLQGKKELQQQVLAYAKTKPARDGLRAQKSQKARDAYRQANESDFIIAEAAARYFKAHGITKLPARKALQAEIEQLISEKDGLYNTYGLWLHPAYPGRADGRCLCRSAETGARHFDPALCVGAGRRRDRQPCENIPQRRPAAPHQGPKRIAETIGGRKEETEMKQPSFCGRELLPLSVIEAARAGDPLAVERVLRYYEGYIDKLCTRTLYDLDGSPHVRVDEYMKTRLQSKLIRAILNSP